MADSKFIEAGAVNSNAIIITLNKPLTAGSAGASASNGASGQHSGGSESIEFEHLTLVPQEMRDAQEMANAYWRVEQRVWAALVAALLLALMLWGGLDRSLWDEFHDPTVCTFVASDQTQRSLVWSAGSALVILVSFSLYVESRMEDIRFDSAKSRTPWGVAKKILVREFTIAGSLALLVWFIEFVVSISEGKLDPNATSGESSGVTEHGGGGGIVGGSGGGLSFPARRLLSISSLYHAIDALLKTLEFFDKIMFLLTAVYMALVGTAYYIFAKTLHTSWGGMNPRHADQSVEVNPTPLDPRQYAGRLSLGVTHFALNFPFYVKVASFLASVVMLADIIWPGESGFIWFESLSAILFPLVFVWLLFGTSGQFVAQNGLNHDPQSWWNLIPAIRDAKPSVPIKEMSITEQLSWARHTKYLKQFIGLLGCMTATLIIIWVLRCMCLRTFDVPWVMACIAIQISIFVWLFVKLPRYVLFLYSNPFVSDPTTKKAKAHNSEHGAAAADGGSHSKPAAAAAAVPAIELPDYRQVAIGGGQPLISMHSSEPYH